jgi:hypothetical protein
MRQVVAVRSSGRWPGFEMGEGSTLLLVARTQRLWLTIKVLEV